MPAVTALRVRRAERRLEVTFEDGVVADLPAEYLRVESPSAEVQGHTPAQKRVVSGKRDVAIEAVEPVGHYAVRIRFSDGHDTGLYTWDWLHRLATEQDARWTAYVEELESRGLHRG